MPDTMITLTEPEPRPKDMTVGQLEALPEATAFIKIPIVQPDGTTRYKVKAQRGFAHKCLPDDIVFWTDAAGISWSPAVIEIDGNRVWAKQYFGR